MIGVLIFPDFQLLDAAGPISVFEIAARTAGKPPAIKAIALTPGQVRSSSGVEMLARGIKPSAAITTLIVAGGWGVRTAIRCDKTLNFVRALVKGGFADLHHPEYFDLNWAKDSPLAHEYHRMVQTIKDSLQFVENVLGVRAGCDGGHRLRAAARRTNRGSRAVVRHRDVGRGRACRRHRLHAALARVLQMVGGQCAVSGRELGAMLIGQLIRVQLHRQAMLART